MTSRLIIGSDNLATFHSWKDPEEILEHHALLVYPREGFQGALGRDHLPRSPRSAHRRRCPDDRHFIYRPFARISVRGAR